jgi:hypothetical protein
VRVLWRIGVDGVKPTIHLRGVENDVRARARAHEKLVFGNCVDDWVTRTAIQRQVSDPRRAQEAHNAQERDDPEEYKGYKYRVADTPRPAPNSGIRSLGIVQIIVRLWASEC